MRTLIILLTFMLFSCNSQSTQETKLNGEQKSVVGNSYEFDYGDFKAKVKFTKDTVTWSADGYTETDNLKIRSVGQNRYFVNWVEKDGSFVTLYIDLDSMKVYNSVLSQVDGKREEWFMEGDIK